MTDEKDLRADVDVDVEAPSTPKSKNEAIEAKHTEMVTSPVPVNAGGDASEDEESFTEVKISDVHEEEEAEQEPEAEAPKPEPTPVATIPTIVEPTEGGGNEEEISEISGENSTESTPVPAATQAITESTEEVSKVDSPPEALEKNSPVESTPTVVPEEASTPPPEKTQPTISVPDLRDRELPPLPDPTPVTPKAGIPIPISTNRPVQLETQTAPPTPMRGSSRNAPTTSNAHKRISTASLASNNSAGQSSLSSMVFVVQALESIGASKDGKRRKTLGESVQRALTAIKDAAPNLPPDPAVVFEPLQIACTVQTTAVITTALDCIGKLISYSYFSILPPTPPAESERGEKLPTPEVPLIEKAIETICDCFQGDTTPDMVQLQIIKALLAAVLNDKAIVHGAGLLKAVRQTYNIFLLSRNSPNQMTAQGTLTQMVHTVFERVKIRIAMKEASLATSSNNGSESPPTSNRPPSVGGSSHPGDGDSVAGGPEIPPSTGGDRAPEKITLQSFENRKSFDDERIADNAPTTITRSSSHRVPPPPGSTSTEDDEDEVFTKDAFLVFRAMCKLSIKTLPAEQIADLKSHGMRSKLLSLHLIHTILKSHMVVFVSPLSTIRSSSSAEATGFVHAVKQYLCLSLSRNAASAVGLVFEVCCEIFWLLVGSMRVMLKKEIEVFLKEIYLNILDNRHSSVQQKQYLLSVLERICSDPRALVEIYLNYDCDRTALDNMFQRLIEHLSRITTTQVSITEQQQQQYGEERKKNANNNHHGFSLPPSLSTANIAATPVSNMDPTFPVEYTLKRQSLECLVNVLQSLVTWSQKGFVDALQESAGRESQEGRDSLDNTYTSPRLSTVGTPTLGTPYPELERSVSAVDVNEIVDDPSQLEKAKQKKTALVEAIKKFNFKPKRGIKALIEQGFIESSAPESIAEFLLKNNSNLDKKMIGEYLGEGEPENVAAMHAFVDQMDFARMRFVDALRRFLQSFRLPGEAQKIDRFMLKFAERYISGNPNAFANADTAYVLAYSVILLNTDQHSTKLKGRARMTPEDFVKNNRGINDNADLPQEYLLAIYEEIRNNEIVLEGEREREAARGALGIVEGGGGIVEGIGRVLANAGRDLEREAYVQASEEMANKTEQLFKTLLKAQRRNGSRPQLSRYIAASSSKHVGPMFEVTWMSILSGLSGAAQDSNETEMIRLCMEGFKLAIRVACFFDLETPRIAFVNALAKFTHLNNLSEMKSKNVEALKALLEVAQTEGNLLKTSWRDVLTCISQLERFQLISSGVDEGSVPDVTKGRIIHPDANSDAKSRSSMQSTRPARSRPRTQTNTHYVAEVAEESRSREVIIAVDKIFANTSKLTGEAIVDFVRALSEVSWQEIQSSGQSEHPRMFSLQKLVEISYYNMGRIRVEWSNLWNILGEHFNQVGCHSNTSVVFFALDSLRQLSMRFLEIEELPHFKFQKDFLKPFEHVMANNAVVPVKDMVLRCLSQMLQARGDKIKSGWRTMFGTFTYAAKENYDQIVNLAFDSVRKIYSTRFGVIISQGGFADMIICLTEFAKNQRFQKISLQAIETLKGTVPHMLSCPECPLSQSKPSSLGDDLNTAMIRTVKEDPMVKFWFPVLFSFHDILMTGEDLEARTRALGYLFDTLVKYGGDFPADFWDTICHELLFPIFMVLKSRSEMVHFSSQEAVGMWLSTTMIQALRNLIALFTHYFDLLERMLDGFLDLLVTCICQENDTIARIGSSCLQQLILQSVKKLKPEHWTKVVSAFVQLFEITTADQLFSAATQGSSARSISGSSIHTSPPNEPKGAFNDAVMEEDGDGENALKINGLSTPTLPDDGSDTSPEGGRGPQSNDLEDYRPQQLTQQPVVTAARRKFFNKIITKCVLQLLMIETVSELFSNDAVYNEIPSTELLRLMGVLKKSFTFARRFNSDKELRMKLWREGFMKQPPNLLKQESGSAATYVSILLRMYHDEQRERRESRAAIESALIPLCVDIIRGYAILDEETQQRNIVAWRPVVVDVMEGYTNFPEKDFDRHVDTFYPLAVELLGREPGPDVRVALQNLFKRVGEVKRMGIMGRGRIRDRRMSDMSGMRRTP